MFLRPWWRNLAPTWTKSTKTCLIEVPQKRHLILVELLHHPSTWWFSILSNKIVYKLEIQVMLRQRQCNTLTCLKPTPQTYCTSMLVYLYLINVHDSWPCNSYIYIYNSICREMEWSFLRLSPVTHFQTQLRLKSQVIHLHGVFLFTVWVCVERSMLQTIAGIGSVNASKTHPSKCFFFGAHHPQMKKSLFFEIECK